mgnify:CR=1 FL=1|tara:strand:- start:169 stop:621 length:453 start_codon:yes stop_codon:yes gene_type:complete
MPSRVKVIRNISWKLELHREVNAVAGMIVKDIRDGIASKKDINNSSFARLKASTVKQKRRKGYSKPSTPLWAKGQMKEVYVKPRATKGKEIAGVQVPKGRDGMNRIAVGDIHNKGDGLPKRVWFGVGTRAEKKIDKYVKQALREKMRLKK